MVQLHGRVHCAYIIDSIFVEISFSVSLYRHLAALVNLMKAGESFRNFKKKKNEKKMIVKNN